MAKLTAMGFKLGTPEYIPGEEDWVYGILVKGKHVVAGDKVSIDVVDPVYHGEEDVMEGEGDMSGETHEDNFEVVPGTEATEPAPSHEHHQKEVVE